MTISLKFYFPENEIMFEVSEESTEVIKISNKETSYVVIVIVISYLGLIAEFRF